ncbi:GNAT family N-acetyltransferase [Chitinimonas arctica]|uniref:GNAT family N-acetyltransferase n=1 Tax=Chitinimonas arctica TaxID=2594795 RepID=A0A516SJS1_9NEIS|nr:GNAT family N-acetyltransferase [Chitinimonas arctica]QDQ28390.1 GNAT family N-acetyltransferase [Chitinimonas arctica]
MHILPSAQISFVERDRLTVKIRTERLELESLPEPLVPDYCRLFGNPAAMEKYRDGQPWAVERTGARLDIWQTRWREHDPFSSLAVRKRGDNQFIGQVVLGHGERPGQSELAYVFEPSAWGQHYGTEAVTAVVNDYAPELATRECFRYKLEGAPFESIVATSRLDNWASVKILTGLGMREIGEEQVDGGHIRRKYTIATATLKDRLTEAGAAPWSKRVAFSCRRA